MRHMVGSMFSQCSPSMQQRVPVPPSIHAETDMTGQLQGMTRQLDRHVMHASHVSSESWHAVRIMSHDLMW